MPRKIEDSFFVGFVFASASNRLSGDRFISQKHRNLSCAVAETRKLAMRSCFTGLKKKIVCSFEVTGVNKITNFSYL